MKDKDFSHDDHMHAAMARNRPGQLAPPQDRADAFSNYGYNSEQANHLTPAYIGDSTPYEAGSLMRMRSHNQVSVNKNFDVDSYNGSNFGTISKRMPTFNDASVASN